MTRINSFDEVTFPAYKVDVLAERGRSALNDFHHIPLSMQENRNPVIFAPRVNRFLVAFVAREAEAAGASPVTFNAAERQVSFVDSAGVPRVGILGDLNRFEIASALALFCEQEEAAAQVRLAERLEAKRQKGLAKNSKR